MNKLKSNLFKLAHKLAKKTIQAGDSYRATFGICLKSILSTQNVLTGKYVSIIRFKIEIGEKLCHTLYKKGYVNKYTGEHGTFDRYYITSTTARKLGFHNIGKTFFDLSVGVFASDSLEELENENLAKKLIALAK